MFALGFAVALPERISYTVGSALMRLKSFSLRARTGRDGERLFRRVLGSFSETGRAGSISRSSGCGFDRETYRSFPSNLAP